MTWRRHHIRTIATLRSLNITSFGLNTASGEGLSQYNGQNLSSHTRDSEHAECYYMTASLDCTGVIIGQPAAWAGRSHCRSCRGDTLTFGSRTTIVQLFRQVYHPAHLYRNSEIVCRSYSIRWLALWLPLIGFWLVDTLGVTSTLVGLTSWNRSATCISLLSSNHNSRFIACSLKSPLN